MLAPLTGKGQEEGRGCLFSSASLCRLLQYKTTPPAGRPGARGNKGGTGVKSCCGLIKIIGRGRPRRGGGGHNPPPAGARRGTKRGAPGGWGGRAAPCPPRTRGAQGSTPWGKMILQQGRAQGKRGLHASRRQISYLQVGRGFSHPAPSSRPAGAWGPHRIGKGIK